MSTLRRAILANWTPMRVFRLGLGGMIVVQAFNERNALFGVLGILFAGMALFNVGCCGGGSCASTIKDDKGSKEFTYEEVA